MTQETSVFVGHWPHLDGVIPSWNMIWRHDDMEGHSSWSVARLLSIGQKQDTFLSYIHQKTAISSYIKLYQIRIFAPHFTRVSFGRSTSEVLQGCPVSLVPSDSWPSYKGRRSSWSSSRSSWPASLPIKGRYLDVTINNIDIINKGILGGSSHLVSGL